MTRAFDALGFDPAPGDLGDVEASVEQYRRASDRLGLARDAMTALVHQIDAWDGEGCDAFARRVADLPDYLDGVARSMSRAAAALADWHGELSELRRRAWELELQARDTKDDDVLVAAERLKQQHDEAAQQLAGLLDKSRDLADDSAVLSRCLDAASDARATVGVAACDDVGVATHHDVERIVGDVLAHNAHAIANASDAVARLPHADLGEYWTPRALDAAVALENAIVIGIEQGAEQGIEDAESIKERR